MGETSGQIVVPTFPQILEFNRDLISRTGGKYVRESQNLLNEASLLWVLGAIQHPLLFNIDPYPTLYDKAALLAWTIINGHVFVDGNKRTGMVSAQVFLDLNDHFVFVTDEEMTDIALRIVGYRENGFSRNDLVAWMYHHSGPKDDPWAHYP